MTIFLLPPICPPFIFATVIPIPEASIPDSEIVTPPPTMTEELVLIPVVNTSPSALMVTPDHTLTVETVVTPARTAPPLGSRTIASVDPELSLILLTLSVLIDILFSYLV